jgi:hypothetical protein
LELTTGPRDDISETPHEFGPVASFEINHRAHDRPFFNNATTNLRRNTPHFCVDLLTSAITLVCGRGVDNFGRDLAVSASKLAHFADLELTTGPAQTEFEDDQHEFAAHTTFQKQQKCNSPVIAGVLGPPLENRDQKTAVRVPPLLRFETLQARCFEIAKPNVFKELGF